MRTTTSSSAKINLFLEVSGKRPDGYHDIESVFLEIGLADRLSAELRDDGCVTLACDAPGVPTDGRNLVVRAAKELAARRGVTRGIHFVLEKHIPSGGGLGGGSSNAAAALTLADRLWETGMTPEEFADAGLAVGSDVPFFFHGGTALCRGRGERIKPLPPFPAGLPLGLVLTDIHSGTAAAFAGLRLPEPGERKQAGDFIDAMRSGDPAAISAAAFNRFEPSVLAALPELAAIRERFEDATGITPHMTGSGSGLWFLGDARRAADSAEADSLLGPLMRLGRLRIVAAR